MLFVSYSHHNEVWLERFTTFFKPLSRYTGIDAWSDKSIEAGQRWSEAIYKAMEETKLAVLLVSDGFLASAFICNEELPHFLEAEENGRIKILWIRLTPCYTDVTPLRHIQAAAGFPKALNQMTQPEWQTAFYDVCRKIDIRLKEIETPVINHRLHGQNLHRENFHLQVFEKPAVRKTEVLVYSGDGWRRQTPIFKGGLTTKCHIGDDKHTKSGDTFKIVALTLDNKGSLKFGRYRELPKYRTKSEEVTVRRS